VYDAWYAPLWRLAVILTRSPETADEIVHTVFFSLWIGRETLTITENFRAYLNTAVRNAARMAHRHDRVVNDVVTAVSDQRLAIPAMGQPFTAPDAAAERSEFFAAYRRTLATLSERERIGMQLRFEEELSFDEIGHLLGISKVGAFKLIQRAEVKVRALLADYRPS
jgi:RNA polymerase sigma-70 factor (ECF subfamily)